MAEDKKTRTPDQIARRKAARQLAFANWVQAWRAENPKATKADRKGAWNKVRREQTRMGLKTLKALEKKGYGLTMPAQA